MGKTLLQGLIIISDVIVSARDKNSLFANDVGRRASESKASPARSSGRKLLRADGQLIASNVRLPLL
jgi:hypothetical protein